MAPNEIGSIWDWVVAHAGVTPEEYDRLELLAAFDVFVARCESARRRGSTDPLRAVSPRASGGNSRRCTRQMLVNLGYTPAQLRVIHRLIGGSTGGWPGLLRLFVEGRTLTDAERTYVRRQIRDFCKAGPHAQTVPARDGRAPRAARSVGSGRAGSGSRGSVRNVTNRSQPRMGQ